MTNDLRDTGIKPVILKEIASLAEKHGVSRVILFGSRARGDFRRDSDIDLAIRGGDAARFHLALEDETSTLLCFDVVSLDCPISSALLSAIQKDGKLLYEKI